MASRRKKSISFERHQEIGQQLKRIRSDLLRLSIEFGNAYPVSGPRSRARKAIQKAWQYIDSARCSAEDNYAADYPDKWTTKTYYGVDEEEIQ